MLLHMQIRQIPILNPRPAPESPPALHCSRQFPGAPEGWCSENYLYPHCAYREEVLTSGVLPGRAL